MAGTISTDLGPSRGQAAQRGRSTGRIVLVVGGAGAIGRAASARFLRDGHRLAILDRDEAGTLAAAQGLGAEAEVLSLIADISSPTEVAAALDVVMRRHGRVDVMVNAAGIAVERPFLATTLEEWDAVIAADLRGAFVVCQRAASLMRGRGGVIINVASIHGLVGEPGYAAYCAAKAGLIALTKCMALELASDGIRVVAVAPGHVDTPMAQRTSSPEFLARTLSRTPLGRVGRVEEVAQVCAFLASDEAAFIHGACIVIDGGQLAWC